MKAQVCPPPAVIPTAPFIPLTVTGFGCAGLLALPSGAALAGAALALAASGWLALKFRRWLGGYTGDCLGAVQQVSEIAFYLGVLALPVTAVSG